MNEEEHTYFGRMSGYKPRRIGKIYPEVQDEIDYLLTKIRNTAKDALSNDISSSNAKKEISNLLNNIKELKKEVI